VACLVDVGGTIIVVSYYCREYLGNQHLTERCSLGHKGAP